MKHTLKALIALMMLAAILLTGCSQKSDTLKNIESQRKTIEENFKTVVVEYDGGTITALEAMPIFASYYTYYYQLYSMFGMSIDDETISELKNYVAEYMLQNRLLADEFDKRGLTLDKTEDEYNTESDENYNSQLESYISQLTDYTEEEAKAYAEMVLYSSGLTIENNRALTILGAKADKVVAAIEDEAPLPTEDDLSAYYTERLAADEETYTATPTGVESAMSNGSSVCWMPEGYRTVKHILVIPEDDVLSAVTDARNSLTTAQTALASLENELAEVTAAAADETAEAKTTEAVEAEATEAVEAEATEAVEVEATEAVEAEATEAPRTAEDVQADIDAKKAEIVELEQAVADAESACIASVQEKLDAIYAALESGSDFESVMDEYGEDPGMQSEPNKTTGYYVREDSVIWDANFTAGAMALANVGDYSAEPVISSSGVHIIYYASDVTPGAVPFESVHDTLEAEKTEDMRSDYLNEQLNAMTEAVNPVYHTDEWNIQ